MSSKEANITIPVDLTNPGQFFACCGLLELADRLWPGVEGWFEGDAFRLWCDHPFQELLTLVAACTVANTMTPEQVSRFDELSHMATTALGVENGEEEKSILDGLRRKAPIVLSGPVSMRIDWYCDPHTRGFTLKTWAGQQSVLTITRDMHAGLRQLVSQVTNNPWLSLRGIALPFNFDSDIGGQGTGRDIGFVFDALNGSKTTRISRGCRPMLEFLCLVGLQRCRPLELSRGDRFRYAAWGVPLSTGVAAAAASTAMHTRSERQFEFVMFKRNKDYYCFFPAIPFQGDRNE